MHFAILISRLMQFGFSSDIYMRVPENFKHKCFMMFVTIDITAFENRLENI